jgi:hypothetical protein
MGVVTQHEQLYGLMDVVDVRPWGAIFLEVEVWELELPAVPMQPCCLVREHHEHRPGVGDRLTSRDAFVGVNIGFSLRARFVYVSWSG